MALLSTQTFAPKSIQMLGWTFFVISFFEIAYFTLLPDVHPNPHPFPILLPSTAMALTFGLFHLIYAIAVKVTEAKQAPEPGSP